MVPVQKEPETEQPAAHQLGGRTLAGCAENMEKSITQGSCLDKSTTPRTLPISGALAEEKPSQKPELARKWLKQFDQYTRGAYDTAQSNAHTLERLLQHAAPGAVQMAQKMGLLGAFPFAASEVGNSTSLAWLSARADVLAVEMDAALSASEDIEATLPLLRYLALHLLHAEHSLFAGLFKEAAWFNRGDECARNESLMFYALFEVWLSHTGREDELKSDGLLISNVLPDGESVERTPAFFIDIWEETLVQLFDEKRDRLAVVARTLPQHKRPDITDEEVAEDPTLGFVVRHWEREHKPTWDTLQSEKAQLEA